MTREPMPLPPLEEKRVLSYGRGRTRDRRFLRGVLVVAQQLLIVDGLVAFRISLKLPSAYGDAWHIESRSGLECLFEGFWFWPSNLLLLFSPIPACLLWFTRKPYAYVTVALFYLASGFWIIYAVRGLFDLTSISLPGCKLWLFAHAMVTAGMLVPTWVAHPARVGLGHTSASR